MSKTVDKRFRFRIALIFFVFLLAFAALFVSAYKLQIEQHSKLIERAKSQRLRSVALTPQRGFIYDTNGEMLAVSIEVDSIYANPKKIGESNDAAKKISKILNINGRSVLKKLKNKKTSFVWLKRKASFKESKKIKIAAIEGVATVQESKRYYPNFNLASHVLGFSGIDSYGLEGLELKYDYYIKGDQSFLLSERDALGKTVSVKNSSAKWEDGCDLFLTIDKRIQDITQTELKKAVKEYDAKSGIAIVQDPQTGKILAMASYPDFNPNTFAKSLKSELRNKAIADNFDPGSTFKPFVVAAALEENVIKPNDIFYCEEGTYYVDSVKIRDTKKHGWLSVKNIIKYSSNIGAIKIAEKLGKEKLYNSIKKFGFGDRSGIDLPGESAGRVRNHKRWTNVDFSTIAFGQGLSSTALQLVNGFSVFANGGKLMQPYIVEKIMTKDKTLVKEFTPTIKSFVISSETAKLVTKYLTAVVKEKGTGMRAALDGYETAGKTGTSQKVDHELKKYSDEKFIGSFIGYAPAEDPVVTVGVFIDEPKGSKYGGVVAAPAFRNIATQILNLMRVAPSSVVSDKRAKQRRLAANYKRKVDTKTVKFVNTKGNKMVMPDLEGMSLRQIIDSFSEIDLSLKIRGSGKVVEQFPLPGVIINKGKAVIIRCAS